MWKKANSTVFKYVTLSCDATGVSSTHPILVAGEWELAKITQLVILDDSLNALSNIQSIFKERPTNLINRDANISNYSNHNI